MQKLVPLRYMFHFQVLPHWGTSFECCHMFINILLWLIWKYCLKRFIKVIDDWSNIMVFIFFFLFCVVGKVKDLQKFLLSCSRKDILNARNSCDPNTLIYLANCLHPWSNWHQWKFSFPRNWWESCSRFVATRCCFAKAINKIKTLRSITFP